MVGGRDRNSQPDWWELPFGSDHCRPEKAMTDTNSCMGMAVRPLVANAKEQESRCRVSMHIHEVREMQTLVTWFLEMKGGMCERNIAAGKSLLGSFVWGEPK